MAKRTTRRTTTTTSTSNYSLVKVCAFWGVILAGIAGLISFMLMLLQKCGITISWGNKVAGIFSLIGQLAIFVSVFLAAYSYSRGKPKSWRILFWVFFILALLGLLGVNIFGMFA